MKRVLMISPYLPDEDGLATYTARLLPALEELGGQQYQLAVLRWGFSRWRARLVAPAGFMLLRFRQCLRADIFHIQFIASRYLWHLVPVLFLRKLLGRSSILTLHEQDDNSKFPRFFQWITRVHVRLVRRVIVHTQVHKDWLPARLRTKAAVIPHPVPGVTVPVSANHDTEGQQLLQIGFIAPWKGYETSIKAVGELVREGRPVTLNIIGKPYSQTYLVQLERLVRELALEERITFTTRFVSNKEYWDALARAFAVLLPYQRSTMSGVLSNVLAVGGVPVMTDLPVFREYTQGKGVYFGVPEDVAGLADCLRRLIEYPDTYASQRAHAEKLGREYSIQAMAQKTLAVYDAET